MAPQLTNGTEHNATNVRRWYEWGEAYWLLRGGIPERTETNQ